MIRMLHIVGSMSPSGIGNFIMNLYRNIDRSRIQFDFIVHEHRQVSFDDEILKLGGKLYYVTRKSVSPLKNFMEIRKIVHDGHYQIVFRHTDTATVALDLLAAKLGGAKRRIPHSHSTSTPNRKMHRIFQPVLNLISTDYYACSQDAGTWLYGHKRFEVIWNGIAVEDFCFDAEKRNRVRRQEGLEKQLVFGHVGNFLPVKNHLFLLEIFARIVRRKKNSRLLLVGDGELRNEIEKKADELGIKEQVLLIGVRNDTADLLQAMDLFFFPSKYEGMPIALVEAQAAGLPCLISDTITEDVIVTGLVQKESLCSGAQIWADKALKLAGVSGRSNMNEEIRRGGFDVKELAHRYEENFISSALS